MDYLDQLAERRIAEAVERGELDHLPGEGSPLPFEDAVLVPAELRTAYRILKNAGYVPPEVECLREIGELERLVERSEARDPDGRAVRRLELLWQRLEMRSPGVRARLRGYRERLIARAGAGHTE
jgi:hypothetical protein